MLTREPKSSLAKLRPAPGRKAPATRSSRNSATAGEVDRCRRAVVVVVVVVVEAVERVVEEVVEVVAAVKAAAEDRDNRLLLARASGPSKQSTHGPEAYVTM